MLRLSPSAIKFLDLAIETENNAPKSGRFLKVVKEPHKPFRKNMILPSMDIVVIIRFAVAFIFFSLRSLSVSVSPARVE